MKIIVLFSILFTWNISANVYSQIIHFEGNSQFSSIREVLKTIERQTEYTFFYNDAFLDLNRPVYVKKQTVEVGKLLNTIFEDTNLTFREQENNFIVITPKEILQGISITGRVTDETGEPLSGVNVTVRGTTIGIMTDISGKFTLQSPNKESVLVFSYIGMKNQEMVIGNQTVINIIMEEQSIFLDEVVTIGYTTSKRRDMIGSVAKIYDKEISTPAYSNFASALQGKASGVYVTGSTIRIRGANSISLSTEPIWIIDGVPGNGSNLNPNDIESVSILKDASATALYGSSGANGVIAVTTKSMKGQKSQFSVEVDGGISELMATNWNRLDTRSFIDFYDLSKQNVSKYDGEPYVPYDPNKAFDYNLKIRNRMTRDEALGYSHKGLEETTQLGNYFQTHVSTAKGFDKGSALFTVTYRTDEGIFKGASNNKLIARAAFNYSPAKHIDFSITSINHYGASDNASTGAGIIRRPPFMPLYDVNDPTGYWAPGDNPMINGDKKYRKNYNESFSSTNYAKIIIELPFVKGLSVAGLGSVNISTGHWRDWYASELLSFGNQAISQASEGSRFGRSYLYRGEINYNRIFGDHTVSALAIAEASKGFGSSVSAAGYNLNGNYPILGTPANMNNMNSTIEEGGSIAYIGRVTYKYKERYLLEGNIRRDGLSSLSINNRWAVFPSLGAGWVLTEEDFFRIPAINLLKIRGSFGKTGNAAIPSFTYVPQFAISNPGWWSYAEYQFTYIKNIPADIKWETSDNFDIGIDFGFLSNRINGSFAYFNKQTSGLLLQVPLPPSSGLALDGNLSASNTVWANVGNMRNDGFEMNINANAVRTSVFSWDIAFNHTFANNEILGLEPSVDQVGSGIFGEESFTLTKKGEKLATYYLPDFAGIDPQKGIPLIWERDEKIFTETGATVRTGNKIPGTLSNAGKSQFLLSGKSYLPSYFGGIRNTFNYHGFDLNLMVTYSGGNYFLDEIEMNLTRIRTGQSSILSSLPQNSWKQSGDIAKYPEPIYNGGFYYDDHGTQTTTRSEPVGMNTQYLKSATNIQFKELTLGYTLPKTFIDKLRIENIRFNFNINNVCYWAKAGKVGNPEIQISSNNINGYRRYEDFLRRTYSFGFSVKL